MTSIKTLDFSGRDQKAQQVCLHYAKQLSADNLLAILECKASVNTREDALALARFFWQMVDTSIEDRDNGVEVLGEKGLQYWMERNMNIVSGYLESIGFEEEWDQVTDEA